MLKKKSGQDKMGGEGVKRLEVSVKLLGRVQCAQQQVSVPKWAGLRGQAGTCPTWRYEAQGGIFVNHHH